MEGHERNESISDADPATAAFSAVLSRTLENTPSENPDEGHQNVKTMLQAFNEWRKGLQNPPNYFQRRFVQAIAKMCFVEQVRDSHLVGDVIICIFEILKDFSVVFVPKDIYLYDVGWNVSRACLYSECESVRYFLSHANSLKLKFRGHRMVDLRLGSPHYVSPAIYAIADCKPKLILTLMRYGASLKLLKSPVNKRCNGISRGRTDPAINKNINWELVGQLRRLLRILWTSLSLNGVDKTLDDMPNFSECEDRFVKSYLTATLMILMRGISHIRRDLLDFTLPVISEGKIVSRVKGAHFLKKLCSEGYVPTLAARYFQPADLKHLCRCVLRDKLNENWQLPDGIQKLQLPTTLHQYLDLCED